MKRKTNRLKTVFLIIYIGIVFIYLLTCLVPFLNPAKFWFIAILGMGFPIVLLLLLTCLLVSALLRSKWSFLALAALLISWQQISVLFAFRTAKKFDFEKKENTLRVLTWNVSGWTENRYLNDKVEREGLRNLMIDAIQIENADVLCLQEFFQCYDPVFYPDNIKTLGRMGYKYYFFSPASKTRNDIFQSGLAIFSKYPISDSAYFKTISGGHSEGFSYADINVQNKTIRFFNTHLESIGMNRQDYKDVGKTETPRSIIQKIKRGYYLRNQQASELRQEMDGSPYPIIFCGDVDDVPNSYAYFKVKGNMQDAFIKKGSGIGRTFQFVSPTLRIDYIMADKKFSVQQFSIPDYPYSDHYPQVMDVLLK